MRCAMMVGNHSAFFFRKNTFLLHMLNEFLLCVCLSEIGILVGFCSQVFVCTLCAIAGKYLGRGAILRVSCPQINLLKQLWLEKKYFFNLCLN